MTSEELIAIKSRINRTLAKRNGIGSVAHLAGDEYKLPELKRGSPLTAEIGEKTNDELTKKYVDMLAKTITDCVVATNQTYVDNMKNQNCFDEEAQRHAFQMTYATVLSLLTDEAKKYLEAFYGDLNGYITNKIEAEVNWNKTSAEQIISDKYN